MAEAGDWTHEQWAEALPPSAAAPLVASRVLAQGAGPGRGRPAGRPGDPPGRGRRPRRASTRPSTARPCAEALAYRGRWTDAAEQYRRAIDQADDDPTRRMWWLNLAEVAQRIGDDAGRARALEAAKAADSADEITRRALQYQQANPGLASPRAGPRR